MTDDTNLPILLDGRGLDDGCNSSKKLPWLGGAFEGTEMALPFGVDEIALGGRGIGGWDLTRGGTPVNMLLLLGGGGRLDVGCTSGLGFVG